MDALNVEGACKKYFTFYMLQHVAHVIDVELKRLVQSCTNSFEHKCKVQRLNSSGLMARIRTTCIVIHLFTNWVCRACFGCVILMIKLTGFSLVWNHFMILHIWITVGKLIIIAMVTNGKERNSMTVTEFWYGKIV